MAAAVDITQRLLVLLFIAPLVWLLSLQADHIPAVKVDSAAASSQEGFVMLPCHAAM